MCVLRLPCSLERKCKGVALRGTEEPGPRLCRTQRGPATARAATRPSWSLLLLSAYSRSVPNVSSPCTNVPRETGHVRACRLRSHAKENRDAAFSEAQAAGESASQESWLWWRPGHLLDDLQRHPITESQHGADVSAQPPCRG